MEAGQCVGNMLVWTGLAVVLIDPVIQVRDFLLFMLSSISSLCNAPRGGM